jgi:hypothetical protein
MSKIWEERGKGLEEEYFYKKNKEAIEKLRAKRATEGPEESQLQCPRCGGRLVELKYEEVLIDQCSTCGGVWLDAGELERLTTREESSWLTRMWKGVSGE